MSVMRIHRRQQPITAMTRHFQATLCLSSSKGLPFWMLFARHQLHLDSWHADPLFQAGSASFFKLELADTNQRDHETLSLSDPQDGVLLCVGANSLLKVSNINSHRRSHASPCCGQLPKLQWSHADAASWSNCSISLCVANPTKVYKKLLSTI
tara:strand:+ start:344 stop:802 length:459 start_codon:yes stop_codon:yes gene_type:complete